MQIKTEAQPHTSADPSVAAIIQVISPVIDAAGLYLEKIALTGPKHQRVVAIGLDLPDGQADLGSAQLEEASRAIGAALDANDPVPGAYTLSLIHI